MGLEQASFLHHRKDCQSLKGYLLDSLITYHLQLELILMLEVLAMIFLFKVVVLEELLAQIQILILQFAFHLNVFVRLLMTQHFLGYLALIQDQHWIVLAQNLLLRDAYKQGKRGLVI